MSAAVQTPETKAAPSTKAFNVGDKVRVHVKIKEGEKDRIQVYEGNVIAKKGGRFGTFTVRKISFGVGVERMFPFNSPLIENIEVVGRGDTTRSKLYYLRQLSGKAARITEVKEN